MMICCGVAVEDGDVRSECEEMKALTVKMETVTLTGKGRQNLTRFVYQVSAINNKIFFLTRLIIGYHLRF